MVSGLGANPCKASFRWAAKKAYISRSPVSDGELRMIPVSSRLSTVLEMAKTDPAGEEYKPSDFVFGDCGAQVKNTKRGMAERLPTGRDWRGDDRSNLKGWRYHRQTNGEWTVNKSVQERFRWSIQTSTSGSTTQTASESIAGQNFRPFVGVTTDPDQLGRGTPESSHQGH